MLYPLTHLVENELQLDRNIMERDDLIYRSVIWPARPLGGHLFITEQLSGLERECSAIKSNVCFCRGFRFGSQHLLRYSGPSIIPVLGDINPLQTSLDARHLSGARHSNTLWWFKWETSPLSSRALGSPIGGAVWGGSVGMALWRKYVSGSRL